LFILNICCAIAGTLPAYTAGVFCSFETVTLAIAVTNSSILDQILQRKGGPYRSFWFGSFKFKRIPGGVDFIEYAVYYRNVAFPFLVLPIETLNECGLRSNLNLVNYVWEMYSFFPFENILLFYYLLKFLLCFI
jgi:hypothetical protein